MTQPPPDSGVPEPVGGVPSPLAEWADRVVATLVDVGIGLVAGIAVFVVSAILGVISDTLGGLVAAVGYFALAFYWLYLGYLEGAKGQSPGKAIRGLMVVRVADGQLLGGGMGVVRKIAHFIDGIICYLGYLLPLIDARKQTIADKIVDTVVLRTQERHPLNAEVFTP